MSYQLEQLKAKDLEIEIQEKKLIEKELRETNHIFWAARHSTARYIVLFGGRNTGKSYEAGAKILTRFVTETRKKINRPHRLVCVRNERAEVTKSQFPLIRERASILYFDVPFEFNRAEGKEKVCVYGNEIVFAGLDDVEKLKSIFDPTSIWIEEANQVLYDDFRGLDQILRGYAGVGGCMGYEQIIFTFNPININSWLNKVFFLDTASKTILVKNDRGEFEPQQQAILKIHGDYEFSGFNGAGIHYKDLNMTIEELNRQIIVKDPITGIEVPQNYYNIVIIHSTYLDNKFADKNTYIKMSNLKETDPDKYWVEGLGEWGVMGGTYFDSKQINLRKQAMSKWMKNKKQGYFKFRWIGGNRVDEIIDASIEWVDDENGYIIIYEEPKKGRPYIIGADTAGGGEDRHAAICIDNTNDFDMASFYRERLDEDEFARQIYCMGKYYGGKNRCANNALIVPEVNFSTHVMKELLRLGYDNMYIREKSPDSITQVEVSRYGFKTTKANRQDMLEQLKQLVREDSQKIKDVHFLDEAVTFIVNENGRPEAMKGQHDDMVMARAIANYDQVKNQQFKTEAEALQRVDISHLHYSFIDDYENASEDEKEMLLDRWRKRGVI